MDGASMFLFSLHFTARQPYDVTSWLDTVGKLADSVHPMALDNIFEEIVRKNNHLAAYLKDPSIGSAPPPTASKVLANGVGGAHCAHRVSSGVILSLSLQLECPPLPPPPAFKLLTPSSS